jgi:hypothetical protein
MSNEELAEPEKDPSDSTDSTQPMTESQRAEIESLGGEEHDPDRQLTRAEAEQLIDQLQHRTGREGD